MKETLGDATKAGAGLMFSVPIGNVYPLGEENNHSILDKQSYSYYTKRCLAPVAQLDRVSDFESEGRRFESCRARHFEIKTAILLQSLLFIALITVCYSLSFRSSSKKYQIL